MSVVRLFRRTILSFLWLATASAASAQAPGGQVAAAAVFRVEVIAATPLPGVDLTLDQIPAPIQTALDTDIVGSGAIDIADFLNRRLTGVYVNELRGNPFQPDVSYRGYTASPLLGTPQGLSVYMDGVRLNQPFGDVVSWDLIPRLAISTIAIMPGSNPLFGLNTLGGALAMQTKTGRTSPGTTVQGLYGSYTRRAVEFEHGGSNTSGLNWYVAGNLFAEQGWRDDSPSDVRQVFGSLGWKNQRNEITFVTSYADNSLTGNGLQEQRFLERDYASVYTKPDINDNRGTFVNVTGRRTAGPSVTLSGNIYYRDIRTRGVNGDINENSLDQPVYQPTPADQRALAAAGTPAIRRAAPTRPTRRFPIGGASPRRFSATSPQKNATGSSTAPRPTSTTTARPAGSW